MNRAPTVETIERYERRVEEIEAERKRASTLERFERRIEEIEAQIKPQIDELRALEAGLNRLREGAGSDPAAEGGTSHSRPRAGDTRSTARQAAAARRRR